MTQKMFYKAGILPWWTPALGFMSLVMLKIESLGLILEMQSSQGSLFLSWGSSRGSSILYMNKLMGPIPAELGQLRSLVSLDLYHNNLTASIPPSLSNLSNLKFLRLNGNRLTGRIPRDLTKLANLKILDVSNNDLCGTIPTSGSFSKLTEESFMNNSRLEGPELMGFVKYDVGGC
ncbi:leucine-rich repeat protein 2-like isoform X3 [Salvia miltiorrhiza]|uniref:leucine-rich repeat protein 2-like isoform X2 n=1 Tax=Salvia miltiorrhiza TaxID=226208 RepID=UPI0025ACF00F|nr:leucine-rich repeat protein 2-like isoform X2 [Salvia miltiorrhiza]XP_057771256.1 leucine-rich repeat protein 2-like isoform X3 [Salvia miltiorrhiza]